MATCFSANIDNYILNVYDAKGLQTFKKFLNFCFHSAKSVLKMWPGYNKEVKFKSSLVICANIYNDDEQSINQQRQISSVQAINVVKQHDIPYIEVSCAVDWHIQALFSLAVLERLYIHGKLNSSS